MTNHTDDLGRKQMMGIIDILELRKKSGMIVFGLMGLMVVLMVLPFASRAQSVRPVNKRTV